MPSSPRPHAWTPPHLGRGLSPKSFVLAPDWLSFQLRLHLLPPPALWRSYIGWQSKVRRRRRCLSLLAARPPSSPSLPSPPPSPPLQACARASSSGTRRCYTSALARASGSRVPFPLRWWGERDPAPPPQQQRQPRQPWATAAAREPPGGSYHRSPARRGSRLSRRARLGDPAGLRRRRARQLERRAGLDPELGAPRAAPAAGPTHPGRGGRGHGRDGGAKPGQLLCQEGQEEEEGAEQPGGECRGRSGQRWREQWSRGCGGRRGGRGDPAGRRRDRQRGGCGPRGRHQGCDEGRR
nr:protein CDV3 homolog isoform X2 [Pongo abelii]